MRAVAGIRGTLGCRGKEALGLKVVVAEFLRAPRHGVVELPFLIGGEVADQVFFLVDLVPLAFVRRQWGLLGGSRARRHSDHIVLLRRYVDGSSHCRLGGLVPG
ncbi:hypothetical protein HYQ46_006114 [Verticillium longisporum]|nr:hypothetical protein HYQ46_006114 [Verticillium longisporum]